MAKGKINWYVAPVDRNSEHMGLYDNPLYTAPGGVSNVSTVGTTDTAVKASAGTVHSVTASFIGVAPGDVVELHNVATTVGGAAKVTLTASSTSENVYGPSGVYFDTGIAYIPTLSSGDVTVTIVYT